MEAIIINQNVPRGTFIENLFAPFYYDLLRARFTSVIARIETAAGVTPGIREACPRETGFTERSFSVISWESPGILL